jgi:uncharacterized protein
MKNLNLSRTEKNALTALSKGIKDQWPQAELKIFGSKIRGTADLESDLDLLIALPVEIDQNIRRKIVHLVFDINLKFESNISVLIVNQREWESGCLSYLPIHDEIEEIGISL